MLKIEIPAADRACPAIDRVQSIETTRSAVAVAQENVRAAAAAAESITDITLQRKISARDLARANHARALRSAVTELLAAAGIAYDASEMGHLKALRQHASELETRMKDARRLIAEEAARESTAVKLGPMNDAQLWPGSTEATVQIFLTEADIWMSSISLPDIHARTDSAFQELRSTVLGIFDKHLDEGHLENVIFTVLDAFDSEEQAMS